MGERSTTKATKVYAVKTGRKKGLFETWEECSEQVNGYKGAEYKGFKTKEEAEKYFQGITAFEKENRDTPKGEEVKHSALINPELEEKSTQGEEDDLEEEEFYDIPVGESEEDDLSQPVVTLNKESHSKPNSNEMEEKDKDEAGLGEFEKGRDENNRCGYCKKMISKSTIKAIECDLCSKWFHSNKQCGSELVQVYNQIILLGDSPLLKWYCKTCESEIENHQQKIAVNVMALKAAEEKVEEKSDTIAKLKAEAKLMKDNLKIEEEKHQMALVQINGKERWISEVARAIGIHPKQNEEGQETNGKEVLQCLKRKWDESKKREKGLRDEIKQYKKNIEETIVEKREIEKMLQEMIENAEQEKESRQEKEITIPDRRAEAEETEITRKEKKIEEKVQGEAEPAVTKNKQQNHKGKWEERQRVRPGKPTQWENQVEKDQETRRQNNEAGKKLCIWHNKKGCRFQNHCKFEHKKLCQNIREEKECKKANCTQSHDTSIVCRYNKDCNKPNCKFIHTQDREQGKEENQRERNQLTDEGRGQKRRQHEQISRIKQFENESETDTREQQLLERLTQMMGKMIKESVKQTLQQIGEENGNSPFLGERGTPPQ
ncbi:DNA ligase 1-like [Clytia hemisphaerica]|uniref:DNA ligase 1-like n=1 Tax=Clytia hemisphaerica TaxID=252671 RepID=UPI0034D710B9